MNGFSAVVCESSAVARYCDGLYVREAIETIEALPMGETLILDISGSGDIPAAHQALLRAGKLTRARVHMLKGTGHLIKVYRCNAEEWTAFQQLISRRGRKPKAAAAPVVAE